MPLTSPQACGVDFEIRAFCAKSIEEKIHKRWAQQRHVWWKRVGACAMSERLKCVCGCVCVGTQFAWWSGRFSTLRRNLVHNQWWRQPAASSCLTGHCTWRPRWTRRCTHTHTRQRYCSRTSSVLNSTLISVRLFPMMHLSSSITMESPSASTSTSPTTPPKQSRESRSLVCPTSVLPVITRLTFIRLRSEVRIRISFIIRKLVNMIFGAVVWSWRVPHWGVMWTAPSLRLWCLIVFSSVWRRKPRTSCLSFWLCLLVPVRQYADICLFSTAQYKCPVAQLEAE